MFSSKSIERETERWDKFRWSWESLKEAVAKERERKNQTLGEKLDVFERTYQKSSSRSSFFLERFGAFYGFAFRLKKSRRLESKGLLMFFVSSNLGPNVQSSSCLLSSLCFSSFRVFLLGYIRGIGLEKEIEKERKGGKYNFCSFLT